MAAAGTAAIATVTGAAAAIDAVVEDAPGVAVIAAPDAASIVGWALWNASH